MKKYLLALFLTVGLSAQDVGVSIYYYVENIGWVNFSVDTLTIDDVIYMQGNYILDEQGALNLSANLTPNATLWFDQDNDLVTVTNDAKMADIFDHGGTAAVFAYIGSDGESNTGRIISKTDWYISTTAESGTNVKITFNQAFSGTAGTWVTTNAEIRLDDWNFIVVTYNNDAITNNPILYVNGTIPALTESSTPVGTRTSESSNDLIFGADGSGGSTFDGRLAKVSIHNLIYSEDEVKALKDGSTRYLYNKGADTEYFTDSEDQDFTAGTSDWTNGSGGNAFGTFNEAGDLSLLANSDSDWCYITFTNVGTALVQGKRYRIIYTYSETTAGFEFVLAGTARQTLGDAVDGTAQFIDFTASEDFATSDSLKIHAKTSSTAAGDFDDFSIIELGVVEEWDQASLASNTWFGKLNDLDGTISGATHYNGIQVIQSSNSQPVVMQSGSNANQLVLNADGTVSMAGALGLESLVLTPTSDGTKLDFELETEWDGNDADPTLIRADFGSATTLDGDAIGMLLDFNGNVTFTTDKDITGYQIKLPAVTESAANTTTFIGYDLPTAGALVNTNGTLNWRGANLVMPDITETSGTVNSVGLKITPGSVTTGGTQYGIEIGNGGTTGTQHGIEIGSGLDLGINDASGITSTATITGEQLSSTDDLDVVDEGVFGNLVIDETSGVLSYTGATLATLTAISDLEITTTSNNENIKLIPHGTGNIGFGTTTPIGIQHTVLSATQPVLFGGDRIGTFTSVTFPTANKDQISKTGIGTDMAEGDLVIVTGGTGATTGLYRAETIDSANLITVDRDIHAEVGDITDGIVNTAKDVFAFDITDGSNGGRLMYYSHQDNPIQIGGDVLVATNNSLGSEDVLFGAKTEFVGDLTFAASGGKITSNATSITIYGGDTAGDDLRLFANSSDNLSRIDLLGAGRVDIFTGASFLKVNQATILTNSVSRVLEIKHSTSNTVVTGFGSSIEFELQENDGTLRDAAIIEVLWTDAGEGVNADADLVFKTMLNDGTAAEAGRFTSDKDLSLIANLLMVTGKAINWNSGNVTLTQSAGLLTLNEEFKLLDDKKLYFGDEFSMEYDEDGNDHMIFAGTDINYDNNWAVNLRNFSNLNVLPSPYYGYDGLDDYIDLPFTSANVIGISDFSFGFSAKITEAPTSDNYGLSTFGTDGSPTRLSLVVTSDFGLIFAYYDGSSGYEYSTSNNIFSVGDRIYVVATIDRDGDIKIYLNGKEVYSGSTTLPAGESIPSTNPLRVGRLYGGSITFQNWDWYSVFQHNRVLTATEVLEFQNGSIPGKYQGASNALIVPSDDAEDDDSGNWTDVNGALTFDATGANHYLYTVATGASVSSFTDEAALTINKQYKATVYVRIGTGSAGADVRIRALTNGDAEIVSGSTVTILATVTAGSFVVGTKYVIKATGTTNFTLIGASDSNVGTQFFATGVGTGTGTADPYVLAEVEWNATETNNKVQIEIVAGSVSDGETILFEDITTNSIGAVAEYDGSTMTAGVWYDKQNDIDGTVFGASLENKMAALVVTDYLDVTGTFSFSGDDITFTSANASKPLLLLENTTDDGTAPIIRLENDEGAAGADNDDAGSIFFNAGNVSQSQTDVVSIVAEIEESADADVAGSLIINILHDDGTPALDPFLTMLGDNGTPGQGTFEVNSGQKDIDQIFNASGAEALVLDAGANTLTLKKAAADVTFILDEYHDTETTTPLIIGRKAEGTLDTPTADPVDDNAVLLTLSGRGYDTDSYEKAAEIIMLIDGTPSSGTDMPGMIQFKTSTEASSTPSFALTLDNSQNVILEATKGLYFDGSSGVEGTTVISETSDGFLEITSDNLKLNSTVTQETYVIRKWVAVTGLTDNAITDFFTITTNDDANDGGGYICKITMMGGETLAAGTAANSATMSLLAHFSRVMVDASPGEGTNSAMAEISQSASANEGTGVITDITLTIVETSEFVQTVRVQIDINGGTADATAMVELIWSDFTTPPVIAGS